MWYGYQKEGLMKALLWSHQWQMRKNVRDRLPLLIPRFFSLEIILMIINKTSKFQLLHQLVLRYLFKYPSESTMKVLEHNLSYPSSSGS